MKVGILLGASAVLGAVTRASAQTAITLDGWEQFRFGMNISEAMTVAGPGAYRDSYGNVILTTEIGRHRYKVVLRFVGKGDHLNSIGLIEQGNRALDLRSCKERVGELAKSIGNGYGFDPRGLEDRSDQYLNFYVVRHTFKNGSSIEIDMSSPKNIVDCRIEIDYEAPVIVGKGHF